MVRRARISQDVDMGRETAEDLPDLPESRRPQNNYDNVKKPRKIQGIRKQISLCVELEDWKRIQFDAAKRGQSITETVLEELKRYFRRLRKQQRP